MSEYFLDLIEVQAVLDQTGGMRMTQGMSRTSSDSSPLKCLLERQVDIVASQALFVVEHELVKRIGMPAGKHFKYPVRHIKDRFIADLGSP